MAKISTFFSIALFLIVFNACAQIPNGIDNGAYIVDKTIKDKVDKKVKSFNGIDISALNSQLLDNDSTMTTRTKDELKKIMESLQDRVTSSMDFKMFENDNIVTDTYASGKSIDECITMTSLDSDTINIIGFMGMFAGFGYQIALFKDTCIVRHFIKSDAEIYKFKKTDDLTFGVSVPCKTYKLTLVNKPTFKKGEVIEGIIELMSEEYYEVANDREKKYKMQLTGYFKSAPLPADGQVYKKK